MYKYASIIPLIGGETIAMEKVFGKRPEYILSYSGFGANDSQLLNHYNRDLANYLPPKQSYYQSLKIWRHDAMNFALLQLLNKDLLL